MLRLWRDRPRLEIAYEFEEYAVRIDGVNDPTRVCMSTRATRRHLREERHTLRLEYFHGPLNVGHGECEPVNTLMVDWRRVCGIGIEGLDPL